MGFQEGDGSMYDLLCIDVVHVRPLCMMFDMST